jgi:hypothetical protein
MLIDDRLRLDDDERLSSIFPKFGEGDPKEPISPTQSRTVYSSIKNNKLLPEDEDFSRQRESGNKQGTEIQKNR